MTTLYKLTDQNGMTQNDTQWGAGVEHTADGKSAELCNEHWLHAYEHPLIAVLMNPAHACIDRPRMWECDGDIGLRDGVLKCGCTRLRTIRKIPVPKLTTEQLIEIAIWIASEVYDYPAWVQWAQGWLTSKDRSYAAAHAAAYAAYAAAHAATQQPTQPTQPTQQPTQPTQQPTQPTQPTQQPTSTSWASSKRWWGKGWRSHELAVYCHSLRDWVISDRGNSACVYIANKCRRREKHTRHVAQD